MRNSRAATYAYYGVPMAFCLAVHWVTLKTWFANDDFAWLGLRLMIHSPRDLVDALFTPMAEGTVRVLSERLYFLVFSSLFGLNAAPFRIWVFLTQFANIGLLAWITRRVTGSSAAGFLAPILWVANSGLAQAMGWSSAYNEILVSFFILLSLFFLLRYIDTGERKYLAAQWCAFLLGFGALELMVMYPVLAAGYTLCCARKQFRGTLLLFIPSIVFTAWHLLFIPIPTDQYYSMHIDASMFPTLWNYWATSLAAARLDKVDWRPLWLGPAGAVILTAYLLIFTGKKAWERKWLPVFLLLWFVIVLLPVLPLKNHFTEYYLTGPAIGLAMLLAYAAASLWEAKLAALRAAVVLFTGFYLVVSVSDTRVVHAYYYQRTRNMHHLIDALASTRKAGAAPMVLLSGVDNDFFWSGFSDDPFRLIGINEVHLVPGSESGIDPHLEWGGIGRFVISRKDALDALREKRAEVYALDGRKLKRLTDSYLARLGQQYLAEHPNLVDVGDPLFEGRLGKSWYAAENSFRWMPKTATIHLAAPQSAQLTLYVSGFCPAPVVAKGSQEVTFRADGRKVGSLELKDGDRQFETSFPFPQELAGKPDVEVSIEVGHTVQVPGESRTFGLVFGTFTIR